MHLRTRPVMATDFSYGARKLNSNTIRLIEILPGESGSPIECHIETVCLEDKPKFTALSYTWGQLPTSESITLNGYPFPVRENLWHFFDHRRAMRSDIREKYWIDAICIDQQNNTERAEQVAMMSDIYQGADYVLVWLGPPHHDSPVAMEALAKGPKYWQQKRRYMAVWNDSNIGRTIYALCNRTYWTRLWIFQELMLAKDVILLCGNHELPWSSFESFLLAVRDTKPLEREALGFEYRDALKSPAMSLAELKRDQSTKGHVLWDLILATQHLECFSSHDKVYGLLGVARHGRDNLTSGYDLPIAALLNQVLMNYHREERPTSLEQVAGQCERLSQVFGINSSELFTLQGPNGRFPTPDPTDVLAIPMQVEWSGLSLWWASFYGHQVVERLLIDRGAFSVTSLLKEAVDTDNEAAVFVLCRSRHVQQSDRDDGLRHAVKKGHKDAVATMLMSESLRELVNEGFCKPEHETLLIMAARKGHIQTTRILMLEDVAANGTPALTSWQAAANGYAEVVKAMIEFSGINLTLTDADYSIPFRTAVKMGCHEIVDMLLAAGKVRADAGKSIEGSPLSIACDNGDMCMVRLLLATGHINMEGEQDVVGTKALLLAAREGDQEIVNILLATGMQLDAESYEGDTPLSIAYGKGHTDVVRSLIETGRFNLQAKALLLAAQAGDQATVDVLLAEGMQPDAGGYQGDSPLSVACGRGHIGMVRSLIETGYTDLQREEGVGESTPLMAALKAGHQEIVYVLLATGTKLDAMRYKGDTPLSIACENGYIGIVRSLIEVGCVDMRTEEVKDQKTPLLSAIRGGRLDIVELLLAAGNCNVNACEKLARKAPNPPVKGMTVLHMVALRQGWEHVAELMLADPNITPNKTARRWEETPLITAAWAGNEAMTRVFLDSPKVDFKAADKQGQNALIHAVERGHNNIVATIIESKRVDLHARDNRGFSAFHLAAGKGHYGIVKQLLDTGEVDPNQRAKCGKTALHLACTDSKFQAVVRLLLAQPNINPNALDKHDSTPLHQARVNKARMAEGLLLKFRDKADATRIHTGSGRSMIGVWPRLATSEIGLDLTNDKENTPADYAAETHHDAMLNESACHTRKRKLHDIESENVESVVSSKQRLDVIHSEDDVVSVSSSDTDSEDAALFSSNVTDSEDVASVSSKDELDDIDSDDDVIVVAMKRKLDDDEIVVAPQRRGN